MQGIIDWFTTNQELIAQIVGLVFALATVITALFNGPRKDAALTWITRIQGWLRSFGLATYKDEPGTGSIPFKKDTGKRIVATE